MFKGINYTLLGLYFSILLVSLSLISLLSILLALFNQLDLFEKDWNNQFKDYTVFLI